MKNKCNRLTVSEVDQYPVGQDALKYQALNCYCCDLEHHQFKVYFVDKQRNAAVVIGDRDLKTDVKNKKKNDRSIKCV